VVAFLPGQAESVRLENLDEPFVVDRTKLWHASAARARRRAER
jgi:hypothetical protein